MNVSTTRRTVVTGALALIAAVAGVTQASASSAEDIELAWWTVTWNDTQRAAAESMIEGFEAEHPNISVTLEERAIDPHKDALRTAAGTPAEPDIYFMWTGLGLGGEFVDAGASAELSAYYEEYGWEERFIGPSLAAVQTYGGFHGVPWSTRGQVVFYRKDLFEQAGIAAEPETYEELVAAAAALDAEGVAAFEFGGTVNWHVMRLLDVLFEQACGAEVHDQLKSLEADWSTELCVTDAFTELQTWSQEYLNDGFMGIDQAQSSQLLFAGQAAMALEGDWFNSDIGVSSDKSEFGLFLFPTGTGRLYGFTEAMYIGEQSEHQDEAAMFLDYVTSTDAQQTAIGTFGSLSVNVEVAPASEDPLDTEWVDISAAADGLYLNGDQSLPLDVTTEYWRIQNGVALGDIDPAEAGSQMQSFINARD